MRGRPSLVGREREQVVLRQSLDQMLTGRGSLVLISGEAGIGKTTVVDWLANEANAAGCRVLKGGCYDLTTTPPYGPWLEILRAYPHDDSLPPLPPFVGDLEATAALGSQNQLFSAACAFFREVGACQPVVLILEDLHWADRASLDFLRVLARHVSDQCILLVTTYRTDEQHQSQPLAILLPALIRETHSTRIAVRPLNDVGQRAFIESRYALTVTDQLQLEQYLAAHSDGNPLYAGELLRTLEDEEVLVQTEGTWHLGDLKQVRMPTLLRHVIEGRLARLGEQARSLLQMAAIIGQDVPIELWQQVSEASDDDLAQAIEEGQSEHLVEEAVTGLGYRFRHALFREALYAEVVAPRRSRWHLKLAETLEVSPDPDPDQVAYHYQQAGDERAIEWLIRAGERAEGSYALPTANERYVAALDLLRTNDQRMADRGRLLFHLGGMLSWFDPERGLTHLQEAKRIGEDIRDRRLAAATVFEHGNLRFALGEIRAGLVETQQGLAALETITKENCLAPDTGDLLAIHIDITRMRNTKTLLLGAAGYFDEAQADAEVYLEQSTNSVDINTSRGGTADTFLTLARIYALIGHVDHAIRAFRESRHAYHDVISSNSRNQVMSSASSDLTFVVVPYQADDTSRKKQVVDEVHAAYDRARIGFPRQGSIRIKLLPILLLDGNWLGLRDEIRYWLQFANGTALQDCLLGLGMLAYYQGDATCCWEQIKTVLRDGPATQPGDAWFFYATTLQRLAIELALDAEDYGTALDWLESHDDWLSWNGAVLGRADAQRLWARYHLLSGNASRAREKADQALVNASDPRQPLALIAIHRFLGQMDTVDYRFDDAVGHLQESLRLADACEAPFERALTLLQFADLRLAQRRSNDAKAMLDEVQAVCEPLEATPTLDRVDALRQRLNALEQSVPTYPAGLTQREVEVLRHVAVGKSNRQIADALFLSPRTVERHIANIYL
ncbi:MAG: AAA family ATPase, partial [Nitrolancea sp.]